jgi:8-oxo-dGTP pyrophosphatase MutT (NUDIX family)
MGEDLLFRLETYFQLKPSPGGLIIPADPAEQDFSADQPVFGQPIRKAAVLIPITRPRNGQQSQIMLTLRTSHLRRHAGQISLPGGSACPADRDLVQTALRETREETQLAESAVEVIGTLSSLVMPSAFHVTPVVGLIDPDLPLMACPDEVEEIFYVPAAVVLNPDNYRINSMMWQNRERKFRELTHGRYRIWGATAAILHHLAQELANQSG